MERMGSYFTFLDYPDSFLDYPDFIPWLPWLSFLDYPDWGFSLLFLSCKANARVKLAKSGHGPHLFRIIVFYVVLVIVLCCCLYAVLLLLCFTVIVLLCYYLCCPVYWLCVLYHCHRVLTQLQLTNISIYTVEAEKCCGCWNECHSTTVCRLTFHLLDLFCSQGLKEWP